MWAVAAVGRLVPIKRFGDFVTMVAGDGRLRGDIFGDGPLREDIEAGAQAITTRGYHEIRLLGSRDAAWLAAEAPAYRAACLPFKATADGNRETGPLVVKEAMAMGLPIVTTLNAGSQVRDGKEGLIVSCGDMDGYHEAINKLIAEPNTRLAMGNAARKRAMTFDMTWYQDALVSTLEAFLHA